MYGSIYYPVYFSIVQFWLFGEINIGQSLKLWFGILNFIWILHNQLPLMKDFFWKQSPMYSYRMFLVWHSYVNLVASHLGYRCLPWTDWETNILCCWCTVCRSWNTFCSIWKLGWTQGSSAKGQLVCYRKLFKLILFIFIFFFRLWIMCALP